MNEKSSSFRKRNVRKPIEGTRTSPQTGQVITSSGNLSLDAILGGGLAFGSICLIEEDKFASHSKVLAKYFLAEGLCFSHDAFFGSLDDMPSEFLEKLPTAIIVNKKQNEPIKETVTESTAPAGFDNNQMPKNGLRIAWRYTDLPFINSEQSADEMGHNFDLSNLRPLYNYITLSRVETWSFIPKLFTTANPNKQSLISNNTMAERCTAIPSSPTITVTAPVPEETELENANSKEELQENKPIATSIRLLNLIHNIEWLLPAYRYPPTWIQHKNLLRICITSLGSPLWHTDEFGSELLKFLTILRAMVRNATAVCFITMPMHLIAKYDSTLVPKIRNLVDYSIELESFAGSERTANPAFNEYHGLLHLHKISAINALSSFKPETTDLAFKMRRKKFVIEKLHLPPELQEDNNDNATASAAVLPKMGCSSNLNESSSMATFDF